MKVEVGSITKCQGECISDQPGSAETETLGIADGSHPAGSVRVCVRDRGYGVSGVGGRRLDSCHERFEHHLYPFVGFSTQDKAGLFEDGTPRQAAIRGAC